jgi:hypothetical protein
MNRKDAKDAKKTLFEVATVRRMNKLCHSRFLGMTEEILSAGTAMMPTW